MTTPAWATKLLDEVNALIAQAEADHKMLVLSNQNLIQSVTPPTQKTYSPGHWVFPLGSQQTTDPGTGKQQSPGSITLAGINNGAMPGFLVQGIKGFLIRYDWRQLEGSTPGDYTGLKNVLDTFLAWAATQTIPNSGGKHPLIQLELSDRSYKAGEQMTPSYMDSLTYKNGSGNTQTNYEQATYDNSNPPVANGWCSVRWLAYVVNAYNNMVDYIATNYDDPTVGNNALFYGIATQETSTGLDSSATYGGPTTNSLFDYSSSSTASSTTPNYFNSYVSTTGYTDNSGSCTGGILYHACNAFKYSYVLFLTNFFTGNNAAMSQIGTAVTNFTNWKTRKNIYYGGPDCEPESASLNQATTSSFPQFKTVHNAGMKTMINFSDPEYGGNKKYEPIHSTLNATSTASPPNITGITKASSAVVTTSTNGPGTTNPFTVGTYLYITGVNGMTQINVTIEGGGYEVTAVGGHAGAWTATLGGVNSTSYGTFTSSPSATAPYYWTIPETVAFAMNTVAPTYLGTTTLYVSYMYWYPTGGTIYSWSPDAVNFIAANPNLNP